MFAKPLGRDLVERMGLGAGAVLILYDSTKELMEEIRREVLFDYL